MSNRHAVGLPPLYTCFICSLELDTKSQYSLRRVKAWVRIGKKTIYRIVEEEPVFAHEHCLESRPEDSPTLF